MFAEIMYGGHISDDWDRKLCATYLDVYMREDCLDGNFELAPGTFLFIKKNLCVEGTQNCIW